MRPGPAIYSARRCAGGPGESSLKLHRASPKRCGIIALGNPRLGSIALRAGAGASLRPIFQSTQEGEDRNLPGPLARKRAH